LVRVHLGKNDPYELVNTFKQRYGQPQLGANPLWAGQKVFLYAAPGQGYYDLVDREISNQTTEVMPKITPHRHGPSGVIIGEGAAEKAGEAPKGPGHEAH